MFAPRCGREPRGPSLTALRVASASNAARAEEPWRWRWPAYGAVDVDACVILAQVFRHCAMTV